MSSNLIVICIFVLISCCRGQSKATVTECEKKAHSSLSAAHRKRLCGADSLSIGPAVCSVYAKDKLHFGVEDILRLCTSAVSAAPAECLHALDGPQRKSGFQLCSEAESTLPAVCFREVSSSSAWRALGDKKKSSAADELVRFCRRIEDRAPLLCVQATLNYTSLPIQQALQLCDDVVGSGDSSSADPLNELVSRCIAAMSLHTQPSMGLTAESIVDFCAHINHRQHPHLVRSEHDMLSFSSAAVECFETLSASAPELSAPHRLQICRNAPQALGPVSCVLEAMEKTQEKEPHLKLRGEDLVDLCEGAIGTGPASCFLESKGIGSLPERTQLCHGASNSGPALCYRRSNNAFRKDPEHKMMLCVSAQSEGPALCASAAPQFLAPEEKVELCAEAPSQHSQDPIKCLQVVQMESRNFLNAPKKALGYFQENIQLDSDWTSRGLLIGMCSFADSQHPLAAAECLKTVPRSLNHDDAVLMCTNVSSAEVIQHIQLCHRILPKTWRSEAVRVLCEGLETREQAEAAVKCAVDLLRGSMNRLPLTQTNIAILCATEQPRNPVLTCVQQLQRSLPASSPLLTNQTLQTVCRHAENDNPAQCLIELQKLISSQRSFDATVPAKLCHRKDSRSVLSCLTKSNKRFITLHDVLQCADEKRVPASMRLKRILSEDGDIAVTSGRRFSVWFRVFDQFDQPFLNGESDGANTDKFVFRVSLNERNAQGAVLWGVRSNSSSQGLLEFNNLAVSQPGDVEFRVSLADKDPRRPALLAMFKLTVRPDERLEKTAPCLTLLQRAICPDDSREDDWISLFPLSSSYSPPSQYLRNLYCAHEDALGAWSVQTHLQPNGALWMHFRHGIDSLWTGVGLPRVELSPAERLGLSLPDLSVLTRREKKQVVKTVKRAYYRASLQWHPDRWANYDQYHSAVQGVFQLISEAYESLIAQLL